MRFACNAFFSWFNSASRSISSRRCAKTFMLIVPYTFGPPLCSVARPLGPRLPLYLGSGWRWIGQKVDRGGRDSWARGLTASRDDPKSP